MNIVCTRKLAAQAKLLGLTKWSEPASTSCWYASVFAAPRQRFVIGMESTTLVTVLFAAKGITTSQKLEEALRTTTSRYFARRGWADLLGKKIAFDAETSKFWAANDRTLLGSLVEMTRLSKFDIEDGNAGLEAVMDRTNDAPMSAIGMEAPEWVLDKLAGKKPN